VQDNLFRVQQHRLAPDAALQNQACSSRVFEVLNGTVVNIQCSYIAYLLHMVELIAWWDRSTFSVINVCFQILLSLSNQSTVYVTHAPDSSVTVYSLTKAVSVRP